jgi:hypothetical protein
MRVCDGFGCHTQAVPEADPPHVDTPQSLQQQLDGESLQQQLDTPQSLQQQLDTPQSLQQQLDHARTHVFPKPETQAFATRRSPACLARAR